MIETGTQGTLEMIRTWLLTIVLLLGIVGSLPGQNRYPSRGNDPGPVGTLLDMRSELGLSADQIARLEAIDQRMDELNQPFVTRMSEIRRKIRALGPRSNMTPEQREQFESHLEDARSVMRQIERNNRSAMHEVGRVLTKLQKEQVGRLLDKQAGQRRGNDNERSRRDSRSDTPRN